MPFIFTLPSFYSLISFTLAFLLYQAKLITYNNDSPTSSIIFIAYIFFSLVATLSELVKLSDKKKKNKILQSYYTSKKILITNSNDFRVYNQINVVIFFHVIGIIGICLYISDYSQKMGGLENFLYSLQNSSYEIRWAAEDASSIGTQLSYFGWIAIASSTKMLIDAKKGYNYILIILFSLQIVGNFLFIDRTRPMWLLITASLCYAYQSNLSKKKFALGIIFIPISCILLFVIVGSWIGKVSENNTYNSSLPAELENAYFYITSGFAYFNEIIQHPEQVDYSLTRTFAPLLKFLAIFGLSNQPPSEVIEFINIPYPTNVGTFLEPFFRDGGMIYVIIGLVVNSFLINQIAIFLLARKTIFALFAWSNLCYASMICFFTPKLFSFPVWLFIILGLFVPASNEVFMKNKNKIVQK